MGDLDANRVPLQALTDQLGVVRAKAPSRVSCLKGLRAVEFFSGRHGTSLGCLIAWGKFSSVGFLSLWWRSLSSCLW